MVSPALTLLLGVLLIVSCSPAPAGQPQPAGGGAPTEAARTEPSRTLVAAVRVEPSTVAVRGFQSAGVALYLTRGLFNAELARRDAEALPQPYLAEALPQLNTDGWRVFPDGRMETTYRLRPNLRWHDGTPFSAEDFVFAWRVYATPAYGTANSSPFNAIEEVTAPDDRTLLIRWRRPYPDAGSLTARSRELPPLPRHVLQDAFVPEQPDLLANHLFWTREFVGLGPYRLDRWEPGSFYEAVAFDDHILGRPKIERIKVLFTPDANTALASILSGEVQLSADTSLRLEQTAILGREWRPRQAGTIVEHANQWRATNFQLRPELVMPRALLDARVRKALAHGVDKPGISDAIYNGEGVISDFIVSPISEWGFAAEGAVAKYPYDLRRAEQLMNEGGFTKGADGFYTSPTEGRFVTEAKTDGAADNEAETTILAATWRQAGFDVREAILPSALAQDPEHRATFSSMFTNNTNVGEATLVAFTSTMIPRAENRWSGSNRGGWVNPEYDRLVQAFNVTLDRNERGQQVAQMTRIFTEEMPSISLFFRTQPWAFVSALRGPQLVPPESSVAWNIHEWEFR